MSYNIKLLEELVNDAVDRLQELSRERDRLQRQVDTLQERLEAVEQDTDRNDSAAGIGGDTEARRQQARALLQEALTDLREGNPAA